MAIEAPTGLVTFAFTDVEGSTGLWEQDRAAMKRAVELHDELMIRLLEEHDGYLVRTEGDSVKAAFASPSAALRWCVAAQRALLEAAWPPELLRASAAAEVRGDDGTILFRGLRVRMGIHPGHADGRVVPATGRVDYFGPDVNTAARVADAPHGGQIIASGPAWEAMAGQVHGEVACRELGEHELKGVALPLRLVEPTPPDLAARTFPAPRTRSARRTNVSTPGNDFVGREGDLDVLASRTAESRLVTVVGPGGTGKTRLVRELGARLAEAGRHPGGVWFVDLAGAEERDRMISDVAAAVSVSLPLGTEPDAGARIIGGRIARLGPAVLILDNLEQILRAATTAVQHWLAAAPELTILATSREPLQLGPETVHTLAPLPVEAGMSLFFSRARERGVDLPDDPDTRATIRKIVEEVDGLSLAVELAAARTDVLSPQAIHKRLSQRFRLLSRSGEGRHDAMRSTLDWSWDLLDADERKTLAQCSVFDGGFTVEAAEEVVDLGESDAWPMDVVQSLRAKSLLVAQTVEGQRRLGMLRLVRAYAADKLYEVGGFETLAVRHARYYLALAERCDRARFGPESGPALLELRRDMDNVIAACGNRLQEDPTFAARIVAAVGRLVVVVGGRPGVSELFDAAVAAAEGDPALTVDTLMVRAYARRMGADAKAAVVDLEAALDIARAHDLRRREADVAQDLGAAVMHDPGRRDEAVEWFERAVAGFDALGEHGRSAVARSWVGIAYLRTDMDRSRELLAEAARLADAHAGTPEQILVVSRRFLDQIARGELQKARAMVQRAYAWHDRLGSHHDCCTNLLCLGVVELADGQHEAAIAAARAGLERAARIDAPGIGAASRALLAGARAAQAAGPIDGTPAAEWYARSVAPLYEPGPADADHPDGTPPLIQASIWTEMAVDYVERFTGLKARPDSA